MSSCNNKCPSNPLCHGGKWPKSRIGFTQTNSCEDPCFNGETFSDIMYELQQDYGQEKCNKHCHKHCHKSCQTKPSIVNPENSCCENLENSCELPCIKCNPKVIERGNQCGTSSCRVCTDPNGCAYLYPCCCRDSFWPNFSHPRWLSCSVLYRGYGCENEQIEECCE